MRTASFDHIPCHTAVILLSDEHRCAKLDVFRIYGTTYRNMSTFVIQDLSRTFNIAAKHGMSENCEVSVPYIDDGLFGWYYLSVPNHGCAASPQSTTQYWFGTRLQ